MTQKGWEYSNSIILHGIEKIYNYLPDSTAYLNYIKAYVDAYINNAGVVTSGYGNTLDKIHPGILCLFLYEKTGQTKYKTAATNIRNNILTGNTFNKTPDGGFWHKQTIDYNNVMMLDGIYMAEPFLVKYGVMFNDDSAINTSTRQTLLLASHVYDSTLHLAKHAWHYNKTKSWANPVTGASPEVWSRAMGWYMMAIVDILTYLPKTHPDYIAMRNLLDSLCIGVKNTQDHSTGLWYQVMDKPDSAGNYLESSGSGMLIYALKKAVDSNWIDADYLDVAKKGWKGLQTKISTYTDGGPQINDFAPAMSVFGSYAEYINMLPVDCPATPAGTTQHPHGYCGVLMAASAMEFPFYNIITHAQNGTIIANPTGKCFSNGTVITVSAVPDSGYEFTGWSGDLTGSNADTLLLLNANKTLTANFSAIVTTYTFTGNGNWNDSLNWNNGQVPPSTLPVGKTIVIDPVNGGECVLTEKQIISTGAIFIIKEGKQFIIPGDLIIQ